MTGEQRREMVTAVRVDLERFGDDGIEIHVSDAGRGERIAIRGAQPPCARSAVIAERVIEVEEDERRRGHLGQELGSSGSVP